MSNDTYSRAQDEYRTAGLSLSIVSFLARHIETQPAHWLTGDDDSEHFDINHTYDEGVNFCPNCINELVEKTPGSMADGGWGTDDDHYLCYECGALLDCSLCDFEQRIEELLDYWTLTRIEIWVLDQVLHNAEVKDLSRTQYHQLALRLLLHLVTFQWTKYIRRSVLKVQWSEFWFLRKYGLKTQLAKLAPRA